MVAGVIGVATLTAADPVGVVHRREIDPVQIPLLNMVVLVVEETRVKVVLVESSFVQVQCKTSKRLCTFSVKFLCCYIIFI